FTVVIADGSGTVATNPGSTTGTTHTFVAGPHAVDGGSLAGYTSTISGDCAADGTVAVVASESRTCTVTHDDVAGPAATLTILTQVVNDDGGTAVASDAAVEIRDGATVVATRPGSTVGSVDTLAPGAYTVDGGSLPGYTTTVS